MTCIALSDNDVTNVTVVVTQLHQTFHRGHFSQSRARDVSQTTQLRGHNCLINLIQI